MSALWLAAVGLPAMLASFGLSGGVAPTPLLVMPFAFADDEDDARCAAHADHMELMLRELRSAIDQKGVYRTIAPDPLLADFMIGDTACVLRRARDLGAAYVLAGAVQNVSAMASNVWLGLFDAADGRRLSYWQSTFRGDNDESWRRAATFFGEEISAAPPPH
ncbi:DUF2380 domain-containing protein [Rhodoblastus sp.]|uniref:DUF2380 domain-containing protein n=1 Tax=Rhodoblastus sp. TaxID=1962975 RepID=UPI0035B03F8C